MHTPAPISSEDGVALVTVALWLPLLVLFVSFVIDIGNWFLHDRHLQLQADAGALAAAGDFSFPCDDATIEATARQYSGTAGEGSGYNHQVGGTPPERVHFELNSPTYFEQATPVDETVAGPPCETGMVDVKLTETDLPLFFQILEAFGAVDFINAHARVEIFEQRSVQGALPLGVPDPNPRLARAIFVDEKGNELDSVPLEYDRESEGLAIWNNRNQLFALTVDRERIEVRIALSGSNSTECEDPLVVCYDADTSGGIVHIRGYSTAGSGAQPNEPQDRNAYLVSETCDPYFNSELEGCTVGLRAEVDFGPCEQIGEVGPELTAVVGNKKYPMSMLEEGGCEPETSSSLWETAGSPIPVPADAGPVEIELEWAETKGEQGGNECKEGGGNKCKGSFGVVQSSFGGSNERSGPIRLARVTDNPELPLTIHPFERCSEVRTECTYSPVFVEIGVDLNLLEAAQDVDEPPVTLRASSEDAETNASQTQALDCDPDTPNFKLQIANGCAPEYTVNTGTACPARNDLWNTDPEPWECVAVATGSKTGQVYKGMNLRVHGDETPSECVNPNNWGDFPPGDPRILPVFITPFGSFGGSGADETVPVTNFAIFYVTGWASEGGGKTSQEDCPGDDPAGKGEIVGHFIQYVQAFNDGSAGEESCDFDSSTSLTPCVAVLTQ